MRTQRESVERYLDGEVSPAGLDAGNELVNDWTYVIVVGKDGRRHAFPQIHVLLGPDFC